MNETISSTSGGIRLTLDAVSNFSNGLHGTVSIFVAEGLSLLAAITFLCVAWSGVRAVLAGKAPSEIISELFQLALVVGLVSLTITKLDAILLPALQGFDWISAKLYAATTGRAGAELANGEAIRRAVGLMIANIMEMWGVGVETTQSEGVLAWLGRKVGEIFDGTMAVAAIVAVMKFIMTLIAAALVIAFVAVYVVSQTMILIGLTLGPLLAPFWLLRPLSFIAEGWFRFIIQAGFQKVAATFVLALSGSLINSVSSMSSGWNSELGAQIGLFLSMSILLGIMTLLMLQSQSIASGLLAGGTRGDLGMPGAMTPGRVVQLGMSALSRTPAAAGQSVGRVAGGGAAAAIGAAAGVRAAAASGSGVGGQVAGAVSGAARGLASAATAISVPKSAGSSANPARPFGTMTEAARQALKNMRNEVKK